MDNNNHNKTFQNLGSAIGSKLDKASGLINKSINEFNADQFKDNASNLGKKMLKSGTEIIKKVGGNDFDNEVCVCCGKKLSLMGNTKIADGVLCKSCSDKYKSIIDYSHQGANSLTFNDLVRLKEQKRIEEKEKTRKTIKISGIVFAILLVISLVYGAIKPKEDHTGMAETPSGSSVLKGENYQDVINVFEEKGFKNISTERIDDLVFGFVTKEGDVEKVSIGGDTDYLPNKWVDENTEVIIYYHAFPEKEEPKEDSQQNTNSNDDVSASSSQDDAPSAEDNKTDKMDIEEVMDLLDSTIAYPYHNVKYYMGTVYVNLWYDGVYDAANAVYQTGQGLDEWNNAMEKLRKLSEDYEKFLHDNGYQYNLTIDLINDKDTETALAEFTNGRIIHDVVNGY